LYKVTLIFLFEYLLPCSADQIINELCCREQIAKHISKKGNCFWIVVHSRLCAWNFCDV